MNDAQHVAAILRPTSSVANPQLWTHDGFRVTAATAEQTPVGRSCRRVAR